ncbi:phosphoglycerate kinase, partial [Candidatus Dojkabacteria bacterium]|nr:phosphoglycerate kinase [Candidatus Dojkabacteria bacterium]
MYQHKNLVQALKAHGYQKADLKNSRAVVRSCLNVPLREGKITDDSRLKEALPLIKELAKTAKRVVIIGHLGRPEGVDAGLSLKPVQKYFEGTLGEKVNLIEDPNDSIDSIAKDYIEDKRVFLLENVRFFDGERSKDLDEQADFAKQLAKFGDIYINDAFPDYRESSSTYYIAKEMPSYIGPSFANEVKALSNFTSPKQPFIALFGGGKVEDKLKSIKGIIDQTDKV